MLARAQVTAEKLRKAMEEAVEPPPPVVPEYILKHPEIPVLQDYRVIPTDWWDHWPSVPLPNKVKSIVNVKKLRRRGQEANVDPALLEKVCDRLDHGASLGARGAGRLPAIGPNHKNFFEMGSKSIDTMVGWLKSDPPLMAGPMDFKELNNGDFRGNPLQSALKPNQGARVCVDQSWPHPKPSEKVDIFGTVPVSVNDSINKDLFKTKMISTQDVLVRLLWCSPDDLIAKIDLAEAYKHCPVRRRDWPLNAVTIADKVFCELSATFG